MRYLTFFAGENKRIDINNSWLGEEKIYYNGSLVSKHTSFLGSRHEFEVEENQERVSYEINIEYKWPLRIGFDIFRNGKPILLS